MTAVMETVVTLTPNPAIDIATAVEKVFPVRKLRCRSARRDPGGGGINVARVVRRFGTEVVAIYPAGGATGKLLQQLVDREGVRSIAFSVREETREDFTVLEESSGKQYRFLLPGAELSKDDWTACLGSLERMKAMPAYVIGSGSLPPGVPADFYARMARLAKDRGSKAVADTSGDALTEVLSEGVYLVKPNLRELQELTKTTLRDRTSQVDACRELIARGNAQVVVLTLGANGALLVTTEGAYAARVSDVKVVSSVGAGDSFVGGMVWKLATGGDVVDAFQYGIAAGSAAVMNAGTELCHPQDAARLRSQIELMQI
jgi:6-phosphofructokinase 2